MLPISSKFKFERETTNTVRYMEVDDDGFKIGPGAPIGTLYVNRSALPRPFPQSLTITVEA